jgi:hypothetical protein
MHLPITVFLLTFLVLIQILIGTYLNRRALIELKTFCANQMY